ncbi:MAG: SLC13 family permease, partial [Pseudomonadota bacterium]
TLRLAPEDALLKGFANSAVWTVAALYVVAAGMYSTGAITLIADFLVGFPRKLGMAYARILPPVAVGSAFLNNTPLVAMMVPVVRDISQAARLAPSKLLMPLSFGSILGGAATLIGTSTNLVIAGLVFADSGQSLNIFFHTAIGLPAAIVGIVFLALAGNRLLPDTRLPEDSLNIKNLYRAEFRVFQDERTRIPGVVGKTIQATGLSTTPGLRLLAVERRRVKIEADAKGAFEELVLEDGDLLIFQAKASAMPSLWARLGLRPNVSAEIQRGRHEHKLVEVVISRNFYALERRVLSTQSEEPYTGVQIAAYSRGGEAVRKPILNTRFRPGDAMVLEVPDDFFYVAQREEDFTLIKRIRGFRVQRVSRALTAALITLGMVVAAATGLMTMLNASLLAGMLMLLTGCLNLSNAWRSIEWDTLVVLAAAISLESAITHTGLSQVIADLIFSIGGSSPMLALATVFFGCIVMTNIITNAAAAAFMFPVAMSLANALDANPAPFIAILMLGSSYAFISPAGYQTNLMVMQPGRYRFFDYVKLGVPLTLVAGATALLLVPLVWDFHV